MALGGFDELIDAGARAFGIPQTQTDSSNPGTSLSIRQLEGDRPIEVVLKGRAMPYRQASWEVSQRTKTTWYPGNPVATQQILGPEEAPTILHGMWKLRFLEGQIETTNAEEVWTPTEAVLLFHNLVRSGKLVRVQWLHEVRTGIIRRFTPTYDRAQDVAWELEFEWQSRNDEQVSKGFVEAFTTKDTRSFLNQLEDIAALAPLAVNILNSNVAAIVDTINRVRDIASNLIQVLRIAETVLNLPGTLMGAIKSGLASLEREITELVRRITGPRSSALDNASATAIKGASSDPRGTGSSGSALLSSSDTQELQLEVWRRSLAVASSGLLFVAQQQVAAVIRRTQPQTTQVITVREEQDLYAISLQYYGTPDFANFLASVNRLTSVRVPPGTQLRIPPRPTGASLQPEPVYSPKLGCNARCTC
jgi:hypothetical protein